MLCIIVYVLPHFSVRFIIQIGAMTDSLYTKPRKLGLKFVVYNQKRVIMAHLRLVEMKNFVKYTVKKLLFRTYD